MDYSLLHKNPLQLRQEQIKKSFNQYKLRQDLSKFQHNLKNNLLYGHKNNILNCGLMMGNMNTGAYRGVEPLTTKTYDYSGETPVSVRSLYSNPTISNGEGERVAIQVNTGHAAIGTYVNKISMALKKHGTLSGNFEYTIRSSADALKATVSSVANDLTTGYVVTELTLDGTILIAVDDRICIEYDSTARTANGLDLATGTTSGWETNTTQQLYSTAGGWVNDPDGSGGRVYQMTFDSSPTI